MTRLYQLTASCLGIGYIKGGGTIAALATCMAWYYLQPGNSAAVISTAAIIIAGIWCASQVALLWGKDSSRVVIDESAGMCVGLLFIPLQVKYIVTGLILFRFFDIAKPLFIRKTESLPGGWGVMADDVLAGIYTNLLLQSVVCCHIFQPDHYVY